MTALYSAQDDRFRLAAARRMLQRQGCDSGVAGHVSTRVVGDEAFWTTPMAYFDEALPGHAVKMGHDLSVLEGEISTPFAMAFHAAIYQARPDVNAITHVHSRYLNAFTTADRLIGMYNVSSLIFHGQQAVYDDAGEPPPEEVARILEVLGDKKVILMRHHGAILVAPSLEEAIVETILLEEAARCHLDALAYGGEEITNQKVIRVRRENAFFRKLTWEANLRRMERTDPDLFACLQP